MSTAATATDARAKDRKKDDKKHPRDPAREVVETVVFVVVLVLLLKLFITEAFVIPTGSMAETLYGYQKVVTCAKCGHQFPVNAHDEIEVNQQTKLKHYVVGYVCPNCRHLGKVEELNPRPDTNSGDRVLVLKPLYHLRPPRRGDVVVFKYPEAPQENHVAANYIKRAMGFGGETVAVHRGKLYTTMSLSYPEGEYPRPDSPLDLWKHDYMYPNSAQALQLFADSRAAGFTDKVPGGFRIVRKEEDHMLADRRIVWDNDKQPRDLAGVPPRWQVVGGRWNADNPLQPRAFAHTGDQLEWLCYQHLTWRFGPGGQRVPWRWQAGWPDRWQESELGLFMLAAHMKLAPVAGPVDNMLGYNAGLDFNPITKEVQSRDTPREAGMWVGDLHIECEAELAAGAAVVLELSKGANRFQAKFGNGQVSLARVGPQGPEFGNPTRPCKVGTGPENKVHKLRFANVDNRLWVWADGKRIDFGAEGDYIPVDPAKYEEDDAQREGWTKENDVDRPASIGAQGAVSVRGIKLFRDVYYTRSTGGDQTGADILYVQPGHYLCLGDNSAQSSDSRRWGAVPERLMLGKAVFVFFPLTFDKSTNRVGFIK